MSQVTVRSVVYQIDGQPYEGRLAFDAEHTGARPGLLMAPNWMGIGEGAERICLVLGVASGSVTALHQMPLPAELPAVPADPSAPATGFAARLSQLMKAPNAPR